MFICNNSGCLNYWYLSYSLLNDDDDFELWSWRLDFCMFDNVEVCDVYICLVLFIVYVSGSLSSLSSLFVFAISVAIFAFFVLLSSSFYSSSSIRVYINGNMAVERIKWSPEPHRCVSRTIIELKVETESSVW